MRGLSGWAAFFLFACAPGEAGARAAAGGAPAPAQVGITGTLLVGNKGENTLSFIDLASGRELGRAATGPMPHEIAVSPDGRQAAVVAFGGRTIDIFDVAARARLRTIDLSPNQGPHGIVWLADGRILVTTERSQSLTIVDTRRGDAVSAIPTEARGTHMVAARADGRRAYTADMISAGVTLIDLEAGRRLAGIRLGGTPEGVALSPDGRTLWVADNDGARVYAFDAALLEQDQSRLAPVVNVSYSVAGAAAAEVEAAVSEPLERALRAMAGAGEAESRISGGQGWTQAVFAAGTAIPSEAEAMARVRAASATFPRGRTEIALRILAAAPLATVATGPTPIRVAASPDGRWIVTSNMGDGSLTIIDARSHTRVREVAVSGAREAGQVTILFSADGRRLYVAETGRDRVAEVDLESGRVLRRLAAGAQGDGLAIAQ